MKTTHYLPTGLFLLALGGWILADVSLVNGQKPTLTRDVLLQATEKAKSGDRRELLAIRRGLERRESITVPSNLLHDFLTNLKEDDPELQLLGAQGLYVLKSPESKDGLVEYLKNKDFRQLEEKVSNRRIDERSYDYIMRASSLVVLTLGEVGDKSLIPLLESLRGVKDLKFEFGGGPVHDALAKLGAEGIQSLSALGPDADEQEVMAGALAVRSVRNTEHIPSLIATVRNTKCHESIRVAAIDALGEMKEATTLPFIVSILKDPDSPLDLKQAAARAAANIGGPEAKAALEAVANSDLADVRTIGWLALAKMNPQVYWPRILTIILDHSPPLHEREKLAQGLFWAIDSAGSETHKARLLAVLTAEQFALGIEAKNADGSPADLVRVFMWKAFNKATGKEPRLEVRDERLAHRWLSHDIKQRFRQEYVHASAAQIRRLVNEKIASIVVKWSDEKGGTQQ